MVTTPGEMSITKKPFAKLTKMVVRNVRKILEKTMAKSVMKTGVSGSQIIQIQQRFVRHRFVECVKSQGAVPLRTRVAVAIQNQTVRRLGSRRWCVTHLTCASLLHARVEI